MHPHTDTNKSTTGKTLTHNAIAGFSEMKAIIYNDKSCRKDNKVKILCFRNNYCCWYVQLHRRRRGEVRWTPESRQGLNLTKIRQRWWVWWIGAFWLQPLLNIRLGKWKCCALHPGCPQRGLTVWALQAWCDRETDFIVRAVKVSAGWMGNSVSYFLWLLKEKQARLNLFDQASNPSRSEVADV